MSSVAERGTRAELAAAAIVTNAVEEHGLFEPPVQESVAQREIPCAMYQPSTRDLDRVEPSPCMQELGCVTGEGRSAAYMAAAAPGQHERQLIPCVARRLTQAHWCSGLDFRFTSKRGDHDVKSSQVKRNVGSLSYLNWRSGTLQLSAPCACGRRPRGAEDRAHRHGRAHMGVPAVPRSHVVTTCPVSSTRPAGAQVKPAAAHSSVVCALPTHGSTCPRRNRAADSVALAKGTADSAAATGFAAPVPRVASVAAQASAGLFEDGRRMRRELKLARAEAHAAKVQLTRANSLIGKYQQTIVGMRAAHAEREALQTDQVPCDTLPLHPI